MVEEQIAQVMGGIPAELMKRLTESLRAGDMDEIGHALDECMKFASQYNYESNIEMVYHLTIVIKNTIRETNQNRLVQIAQDYRVIQEHILALDTWQEMKAEFLQYLSGSFETRQQSFEQDRNQILIDTIKEIVQANYSDINLSIPEIASMLKMSSSYLGRLFKSSEQISLAQYINDVRLDNSLRMLREEDFTVNEILEKVGFTNQSYFFTLFKKKFGVTPKEYRMSLIYGKK